MLFPYWHVAALHFMPIWEKHAVPLKVALCVKGRIMISEELVYPRIDAARSVLAKIGVDPATRDFDCQDYEYTTCNMSELERYIELYPKENTNEYEKRVLGCYIIEALNDFVSIETVSYTHLTLPTKA